MVQSLGIALGVPIIFLLCGAMGRKLVRGTPWNRKDFYLGVPLTLATFSSNLLFVVELLRSSSATGPTQAITALFFAAVVFATYIWLLTLHQDWEVDTQPAKGQILRLVVVSNMVGIVLFAAFVFMIKGVR